jgi:ubiquinone/menaquinone biosynthesis C-methylase UbiE
MKLEIGGGTRPQKGFIEMDAIDYPSIDLVHDATITPYPFDDNSLDEVYSHWVLEHFSQRHIGRILKEWLRVIKVGGIVNATTNNCEAHNKALADGIITWEEWTRMIFGIRNVGELGTKEDDPVNVWECHKIAWSESFAREQFLKAGFSVVQVDSTWKHREGDGTLKCPGIIIKATK